MSRKGCNLRNFKEVNSNQYIEKGAYTAGFEFRNHIILGSDTGLNNKQLNTFMVDRLVDRLIDRGMKMSGGKHFIFRS